MTGEHLHALARANTQICFHIAALQLNEMHLNLEYIHYGLFLL